MFSVRSLIPLIAICPARTALAWSSMRGSYAGDKPPQAEQHLRGSGSLATLCSKQPSAKALSVSEARLVAASAVAGWVTYLLVSPTRSSLIGVARGSELRHVLAVHNGSETSDEEAPAVTVLRPWCVADFVAWPSRAEAVSAARRVSHASGFRARVRTLRQQQQEDAAGAGTRRLPLTEDADDFSTQQGLDALTYVPVEFVHPDRPEQKVTVCALVDTGSSTGDLRRKFIDKLGLQQDGTGMSFFETASGRSLESQTFCARARFLGQEAVVKVNPSEEDGAEEDGEEESADEDSCEEDGSDSSIDVDKEFGLDSISDDAVLGHEALSTVLLADERDQGACGIFTSVGSDEDRHC
eukprot:TRINITY_DN17119_c0_g2_i1.p1 TRINITY_DN17119_c0_g2~~TRINITY_DN17119_c0_g2_i1.p1  ORF type:complete len:354 (+),score=62.05 TRINITY_DN17119_c0_g2_i1:93-1154(+)